MIIDLPWKGSEAPCAILDILRGCNAKCAFCYNQDKPYFKPVDVVRAELDELCRLRKLQAVMVSGGEPLAQADFVAKLFEELHKVGINTALDTAGYPVSESVKNVLKHTDTVLCDIKFPTDEQYKTHIGTSLETTLDFIDECNNYNTDIIIRHVVVPGMTDSVENIKQIAALAKRAKSLQKIELLPFKKLCVQKYNELGLDFPLKNTPECTAEKIEQLKRRLDY